MTAAVSAGISRASIRLWRPSTLLAAGEMGIGNTTTSAAVAAVLLRADARSFVGRGAGLSDASLARKRDVVKRAIDANSPDPADPIDVLSKVGGFDIAAMCGFYLGAAASKAPALLDGVISCAAALCAARLCPNALGYLVGTHASSEPASQELLRELGIKAPPVSYTHLDVYKRQGLVCLVVVRVVARDHHERCEHGLLVACGARGGDNILAGRFQDSRITARMRLIRAIHNLRPSPRQLQRRRGDLRAGLTVAQ